MTWRQHIQNLQFRRTAGIRKRLGHTQGKKFDGRANAITSGPQLLPIEPKGLVVLFVLAIRYWLAITIWQLPILNLLHKQMVGIQQHSRLGQERKLVGDVRLVISGQHNWLVVQQKLVVLFVLVVKFWLVTTT